MSFNLMKGLGLGEMHNNLKAMGEQIQKSSSEDVIDKPQNIQKTGGGEEGKRVRSAVLKKMPKSEVEKCGGRMKKCIKVGGKVYKCEATKVGKSCRYNVRL